MPLRKLNPTIAQSTDDLISQIEHKDRRFRLAQTIFMISTLLALVIVISAQQRTLDGVKDQLAQAKSTAETQAKQSDEQRDKIIRRLDCMVVFFTQADRTNLTIENIEKCSLNRDENIDQFFKQPESSPAENPPNLTPGSSPTPGPTAQPNQPQTINPNSPGLTPFIPQQPVPTPDPPPFEVLGIPACIPFTGVCVR